MKKKKHVVWITVIFLLMNVGVLAFAATSGNTDANITFESGTLTLAEMSSFSFGTHKISSITQNYPALESSVFLDIRDLRGTGEGWKITAFASKFSNGTNNTLFGTSINLINGTAVSVQPVGNNPNVIQNIKMDCDGAASVNIASALVGGGLGIWTIEWNGNENNNINATLNVPGGIATIGKHTATITWTLSDAP